ncbi:MAG TPA: acyl-CoA dehydrogenase family protein [Kofleriaceae bacterium]|jgi:alkylation response protein AidB-like acyl-CoA dehydrogenase|nr:acyl-CoA dehydrogenase family protein [Kofleriaceae bacterium]
MFYLRAVRFAFSEEQEQLRRSVRRALEAHATPARRRAAIEDGACDGALWRLLGAELGLAGLVIPERHGGAGLGWVELVAVMEELGHALACVPVLSTTALATAAILSCADDGQQAALLPPIAAGEATAALAWLEFGGKPAPGGIQATATDDGGDVILSGRKRHVVDGHSADLLLVAARAPGSAGADGIALYAVPGDADGLRRQRLPTMDPTRPLAEVILDDVRLPGSLRLGGGGWPDLERALQLAAVALAAEQVGGAQRCLELAVDYAKVRHQFGRPIGSFQAIQHICADMFVQVEAARSAAWFAGWTAAEAPAELDRVAPAAAACASDAFFACAGACIQVHGGIGFTWEHEAHLYFKRARASRALLAAPSHYRAQVAHLLLGEP